MRLLTNLLISPKSEFYYISRLEYLKSKILFGDLESINKFTIQNKSVNETKLVNISYLLSEFVLPEKDRFLIPFDEPDKEEVQILYNYKKDPPYKSPVAAGILSALIPGSGKLYTGQISEGITSFLLNGLFAFISYNNFQNNHNVRGWIFAGVTALLYSGNIYGSAASAQIYNTRIDYEYAERVKKYLAVKNYFIDDYDFCNK
jgi:TM2 domain-containing membrane protein YozV